MIPAKTSKAARARAHGRNPARTGKDDGQPLTRCLLLALAVREGPPFPIGATDGEPKNALVASAVPDSWTEIDAKRQPTQSNAAGMSLSYAWNPMIAGDRTEKRMNAHRHARKTET